MELESQATQAKLAGVHSERFLTLRKALQETEDKLHALSDQLQSDDHFVQSFQSQMQNLSQTVTAKRGQLSSTQTQIREFTEKLSELDQRLAQAKATNDLLKQRDSKILDKFRAIEAERDQYKASADKLETQIRDLRIEIEKLSNQQSLVKSQVKTHAGKLREILSQHKTLWHDYELYKAQALETDPDIQSVDVIHQATGDPPKYVYDIETKFSNEQLAQLNAEKSLVQQTLKELHEKANRQPLPENASGSLKQYYDNLVKFKLSLRLKHEAISRYHQVVSHYNNLTRRRRDEFQIGFGALSGHLREIYRELSKGGDAELEFVDSTNPFSEGIGFTVRPPKKTWKRIVSLSGGEKTISSIALIFALHLYKPNPIYVLDEIDAALDYHNVDLIVNFIRSKALFAQFIIVSLRINMFDKAQSVVGVYKTNNTSKALLIQPSQLANSNFTNRVVQNTLRNLKLL